MRADARHLTVGLLVATVVAVSACGSDSDGSSGGGESASADASAQAATSTVPEPATTPPTEIGVSTKLTEAPPKGKTVAWLACELPSCETFTPGFEAATGALGWNLKKITYKGTSPGSAVQQAVSEGVDYIAMTGVPPVLFKQELAAANAQKIPFISANDVTPPAPDTGLMTQFGDQTMFGAEAEQLAHWILRDSGGKAKTAYVTIADYPILGAGGASLKETLAQLCPKDCSSDDLPVTGDEIGSGAVPAKVVAYLQSHPDVNYVVFSFADPLNGVPQALKAAGLDKDVKLTGLALGASPAVIGGLNDGTLSAWVAQPNIYQAWLMVDAMARLSVGMSLDEEREAAKMPTWVADSPEATGSLTDAAGWEGPEGFQDSFKQLWAGS